MTGRSTIAAWAAAALLVALAGSLLAVRVVDTGLETGFKDQRHYLASAVQLADHGRLALPRLDAEEGRVVEEPLSSFPPATSIALAALMELGVSPADAPTVLALFAWPLLLIAIGALAHRLSGDPVLTLLAIAIAGITWPYLNVYTEVTSEILYLPLTVLTVLALDGQLEADRGGGGRRLLVASGLLTLTLLVRYTGIFLYAAVVGWWVGGRLLQGRWRRLGWELPILALPGLVLALWLIRNVVLVGHPFGPVLMSSTLPSVDARDVARSFAVHGTWLVLPAVRPGSVWRWTGLAGLSGVGLVALGGCVLAWLGRRPGAWRIWHRWPRSPLVPFLGIYLAFLALAPTFMRMRGMIERYMAVVLCLAQPFLVARLGAASRRAGYLFLTLFLALNLGAALAFTASTDGLAGWFDGPRARDLGGRPDRQMEHLLAGTPAWWVHRPPRTRDLENHLPGVARFLDTMPPGTAVVSNVPELFSWRPLLAAADAVPLWLEAGSCEPAGPLAVVLVDWDRWGEGHAEPNRGGPPSRLRRRVEERCPALPALETPHAVVYWHLGADDGGTP